MHISMLNSPADDSCMHCRPPVSRDMRNSVDGAADAAKLVGRIGWKGQPRLEGAQCVSCWVTRRSIGDMRLRIFDSVYCMS